MHTAEIRFSAEQDVMVVTVTGELDHSNADDVLVTATTALTGDTAGVVLDLTGVTYLDSAAINVIFLLDDQLQRSGQHLRLAMLPDAAPRDALAFAGVLAAVTVTETVGSATASIRDAIAGSRPQAR